LGAIYPEHQWREPKQAKQRFYWKDINHQRQFFNQAALALDIQHPHDWYTVKIETLTKMGGHFIKKYYNSSVTRGT
jgi:hypothetical protein